MKNNIRITFNQFTKEILKKGLTIKSIKTQQLKDKSQLLINIASLSHPAVFDWNEEDKRWLLCET